MVSKGLWKPKGWELTYYGVYLLDPCISVPLCNSVSILTYIYTIFLQVCFAEERAEGVGDQHFGWDNWFQVYFLKRGTTLFPFLFTVLAFSFLFLSFIVPVSFLLYDVCHTHIKCKISSAWHRCRKESSLTEWASDVFLTEIKCCAWEELQMCLSTTALASLVCELATIFKMCVSSYSGFNI